MNDRFVIAIEGNEVIEKVAEHFGRCTKFKVCELDEDKILIKTEIYFNPLVGEHNGACQLPGYVKQFNVNTIIAGGMGQKAINNFLNYGINVITAPGVEFKKALKLFVEGKLDGYNICKQEHIHH
ncbi:MAG: NifB/NifX family molybdenum-iron cluster-binding protein [Ignavibacteriaceae bacterium]